MRILQVGYLWCLICIFPLYASKADEDWNTKLDYARILSYMQRFPEAETQFKQLLAEKPNSTLVKVELAKVYSYEHKTDDAMHLLNQIPKDEITPEVEIVLADIYVAKKQYSEAEALYKKNLEKDPKLHDVTLLKLAQVQSWERRYDESLHNYEILLQKYPDDKQLRRNYAYVLYWSGQHDKAAKELEDTLK